MKVVRFQKRGHTIEVKRGREKGIVNIRHSKFPYQKFGRYHEYADVLKTPRFAHLVAGIDLDHPRMKATLEKSGAGFMLLSSKVHPFTVSEVALIRAAIRELD